MKNKITLLFIICFFMIQGCTPTMNLSVNYSNIDTSETDLKLHFGFERKTANGMIPLALQRIWIYKDDRLLVDLQNSEHLNDSLYTWKFPSIPKGFKITFPENVNAMPPFKKTDHLKFEFLAGGAYSVYKHKANS